MPMVIYNRCLSQPEKIPVEAGSSLAVRDLSVANESGPGVRGRLRQLVAAAALAQLAVFGGVVLGCGDQYRPVESAINPVGPAAQPAKYAVVVSNPGVGQPGLLTIVDFSGDSILINANLGVGPQYLILGQGGTEGYVLNSDGTLNSFSLNIGVPPAIGLETKDVQTTTLLPGALPSSVFPYSGNSVYVTEPGRTSPSVAVLAGAPPSVKQELPVGAGPVFIVGQPNASRIYSISHNANQVSAIQPLSNTISNTINVGSNPVYGVMSPDTNRAFIMNQGDGTVSVINVQTNLLDATHPALQVGQGPVWADIYNIGNELVVANSISNSVSIISVPLCNNTAQPGNPTCDPNNPQDAANFGTTTGTVAVGRNPVMVTVLQDGTRAYTANQADGTVSVVNLATNTVTKTIPVNGHPTFVQATTGTPTGKVYVISPDSNLMTVISTQTDTVTATVALQGLGVQVRVTQP